MDYKQEISRLRFQSKINKTESCWLWTGGCFQNTGYGAFRLDGKQRLAHRVARFFEDGVFPEGVVRHTCDNKRCVNPSHLLIGTQQDNINDMMSRGRYKKSAGESNGHAKLTNDQVLRLRKEYSEKPTSTAEIARRLGISQSAAWRMLRGQTYNIPLAAPLPNEP